MAERKKVPVFKICFSLFVITQLVFWACIMGYVYNCLRTYEAAQPERVVEDVIAMLRTDEAAKMLTKPEAGNRFEDTGAEWNAYLEQLKSGELTYTKSPSSYDALKPEYNIYSGEQLVAKVGLEEAATRDLMFILKVQEWGTPRVETVFDTDPFAVTLTVPDNFTVFLNDVQVQESELAGEPQSIEAFENAAKYTTVPELVTYHIEGFSREPEILIYDNNMSPVEFEKTVAADSGDITIMSDAYQPAEMDEELQAYVMKMAKEYSNFFSGDLVGGRQSVEPLEYMFPEGSDYLELADNYRMHDLWMYSDHKAPTFSNEQVSDYRVYTEDFFSCHVYFDKTMELIRQDLTRTVTTDTTFYYVKIGDRWAIVDMRDVIE